MIWRTVASDPPPAGQRVLALWLSRYVNADWRWSGPRVMARSARGEWIEGEHSYESPELWCELPPLPDLPDEPERVIAKAVAERNREYNRRVEALRQEMGVSH